MVTHKPPRNIHLLLLVYNQPNLSNPGIIRPVLTGDLQHESRARVPRAAVLSLSPPSTELALPQPHPLLGVQLCTGAAVGEGYSNILQHIREPEDIQTGLLIILSKETF